MKCYNCDAELSEKDYCTACGADVSKYKKIIYMSHRFYNDGLERQMSEICQVLSYPFARV